MQLHCFWYVVSRGQSKHCNGLSQSPTKGQPWSMGCIGLGNRMGQKTKYILRNWLKDAYDSHLECNCYAPGSIFWDAWWSKVPKRHVYNKCEQIKRSNLQKRSLLLGSLESANLPKEYYYITYISTAGFLLYAMTTNIRHFSPRTKFCFSSRYNTEERPWSVSSRWRQSSTRLTTISILCCTFAPMRADL